MKNELIFCKCGCGNQRWKYDSRGRERRYIVGHSYVHSIAKIKIPWNKGTKGIMKSHRKGILLKEEYGEERAKILREKMSKANKGRIMSQTTKQKLSELYKGRKPWITGLTKETDDRVMRMSQTKKGRNPWTYFKNPDGAKTKLSLANKGRKITEEHIQKLIQSHIGKKPWNKGLTKETDERINIGDNLRRDNRIKNGNYVGWNKGLNAKLDNRIPCKERHGRWLGGISYEPYTTDFTMSFKRIIKKRDNYTCQLCSLFEIDHKKLYGGGLCVHHIDYDKKNTFPQNCISLCNRCNILVNKDREIWTKHFQELLRKLYNYEYTQDQKIILDFITNNP